MYQLHPCLCISQKLVFILKHLLNERGKLGCYYVLDELVLSVQDDVTQLPEVFNYYPCLVAFHEEELTSKTYENFVVIDELGEQGV
jgi:hypothetical protein